MQTIDEIWKDIQGYEGLYQISNLGRLRFLEREKVGRVGNLYTQPGGIKKTYISKFGYERSELTDANGNGKQHSIHRLVAMAFIPNLNNLPEVNHKNGIKNDNRVENLEWCTQSENTLHGYRALGRTTPNKNVLGGTNSKKIAQCNLNGELLKLWPCISDVKRAGICRNASKISQVAKGSRAHYKGFIWKYVDQDAVSS